jgi:hypothetical protein
MPEFAPWMADGQFRFHGNASMWHTQEGDRVLTGTEATLFRESLGFMVDVVQEGPADDPWTFGVDAFDRLTVGQKLTMLRDVAKALLDPQEPMPELTAVNEATVAAVYQNLLDNTRMEVEDEGVEDDAGDELATRHSWRRLIMAAIDDLDRADNLPPVPEWRPTAESNDMADWEALVVYFENRILWDDGDGELESDIADCSPEEAQHQRDILGITDEYYLAVAPDPPDSEIPKLVRQINALCGPDAA